MTRQHDRHGPTPTAAARSDRGCHDRRGSRRLAAAALGLAGVTLAGLVVPAGTAQAATGRSGDGPAATSAFLVEVDPAAAVRLDDVVARLDGAVRTRLPVIGGALVTLPQDRVDALRAVPGVRRVSHDATLLPLDGQWGDDDTFEDEQASRLTGTWKADMDQGSTYSVAEDTYAKDVWGKTDPNNGSRKLTGHGVGVAVVDTGIAAVEGLLTPGKIVQGPDLSFESQAANLRHQDGFGHGTHLAGIIAGKDSSVVPGGEHDPSRFTGMAPDARLVNVRVGTADGGVDVSQVIAGIDWVVANRARHNIRVLNLSYGTDSTQAYTLDPLAHAVENAWRAGIVVVVAAGNDGESGPRPLTMPAADPFVLAVGSVDHRGSDQPDARRVGPWTNSGTTARRPDLLAPGKSLVSLRVPGSQADRGHPEGLVTGDTSGRLFRGTGTSQSAAVVSGAVALLLQRNPALTPDQVKALLLSVADRLPRDPNPTQGAGMLDVKGAVERLEGGMPPASTQTHARSTGRGSLDAARGGSYVVDPETGSLLRGERDVFGVAWDAASWSAASAARTAWSGGTWRGSAWAGATWTGDVLSPVSWTRPSWTGSAWTSRRWSTMTFLSRRWSGDDWTSRRWSADGWSSRSWRTDDAW